MEKPIDWRGSSLDDLREFPESARREAGYELRKLQRGEAPDDWRPFPEVGPGVKTPRNDVEITKVRYRAVEAERKGSK